MGGGKQTTTSHTDTQPWSVQIPYLQQAFSQAQTAEGQAQKAVLPQNFVAQLTPQQLGVYNQMVTNGTNQLLPSTSAGVGSALGAGGSNATLAGLYGLGTFRPQGGINSDIAGGNQYVAGMNIPQLVQAEMLPAVQTASEQTLPQIARMAAGSGNINSSRTAIQQGLVRRGLAQQAAANAAQLQGQGFQTGAGLTEASNQALNNANLTALTGLVGGGNQAAGAGVNALNSSVAQQGQLANLAQTGVMGQYNAAQAQLQNLMDQYQAQVEAPFDAIKQYYSIVGGNNWGGTSNGTSTTTMSPSPFSVIGGLLSGIGGLFSDVRVKTDISLVGELFNGMKVYRFRYVGDPSERMYIGLMAQEVERVNPEAVHQFMGVKAVDYEAATANSIKKHLSAH